MNEEELRRALDESIEKEAQRKKQQEAVVLQKEEGKEEMDEIKRRVEEVKKRDKKAKIRKFGWIAEAIMGTLVILFLSALLYLGLYVFLASLQFLLYWFLGNLRIEFIFYWLKLIMIPISIAVVVYEAYTKLAPKDIFFTLVEEGTAKIVTLGKAFNKILLQWEGYELDTEWNIVYTGKTRMHLFGGFRYIGVWPFKGIYEYVFKWTGLSKDNEIEYKTAQIKFVLLKPDNYLTNIEKAEDKKGLAMLLRILLTLQIINPKRAIFEIQSFLETVVSKIKPDAVAYVRQDEYSAWQEKTNDMGKEILKAIIASGHYDEFRYLYGVLTSDIGLQDLEPPEAYRNTTLLEYTATKEANAKAIQADGIKRYDITVAEGKKQATILAGQGEKERLMLLGEGEKAKIALMYEEVKKFGDLGRLIKVFELASESKSSFAASLVVQRYPGIESLLSDLFEKKPEEINNKEIKTLTALLKKIAEKEGIDQT
jgi:hypothetical protein